MADQIREEEKHDGQRIDREALQPGKVARSTRILRSQLTVLELNVVALIYQEACSVKDTAHVLRISEAAVKRLLWDITERMVK